MNKEYLNFIQLLNTYDEGDLSAQKMFDEVKKLLTPTVPDHVKQHDKAVRDTEELEKMRRTPTVNVEELKEQLAEIEHQRWADWQKYMHSKFVEHSDGEGKFVCLPVEWFKRWEKQVETPYSQLTEREKDSDREQVERYLPLIKPYLSRNSQSVDMEKVKEEYNRKYRHRHITDTLGVPNNSGDIEYDQAINEAQKTIDEYNAVIDKIWNFFLPYLQPQQSISEGEVTGETSDGYHTFNELYEFRKLYNAGLFNEWSIKGLYGVHKSKKHSDGLDCFGGGWFIVTATLPTGQISNHYELKDWDLFQCEERELADVWDGHTPQDVAKRLTDFLALKTNESTSKEIEK